jgi:hypothetical protein
MKDTLSLWGLPDGSSFGGAGAAVVSAGSGGGLRLVGTLGGVGSAAPMQFDFHSGNGVAGYLAFTPPSISRPLLLVTDHGHDAVHVVDVVGGGSHVGYLAPPGSIAGPRGVAASGTAEALPLVAVSAWKYWDSGDHVVHLYRGSGAVWEAVRVIGGGFGRPGSRDGQLKAPHGLRFNRDGSVICVADYDNNRASVFRVGDGGFVRHMATEVSLPKDVEEVEGGWLVACINGVQFVGDGGGRIRILRNLDSRTSLVSVPGLGLVARHRFNGLVQMLSTPDLMAMWCMSSLRVAWITAVVCSRGPLACKSTMP